MYDPVIRTVELTRRFGAATAVDRVDLEVPRGSVYGFLGPNGAGKTVTIRMLLGLLRPTSGDVRLFGERLTGRTRLRLAARVGALVEAPSLYPHLTGRENLEVSRRLLGVGRGRGDRALEIVRLPGEADRLVREYSLGMRQRLGIALALLTDPELLILDEPTNGLDPAGIHEIRELIRRLPSELDATVFLSSHLLSEVEQTATDIGIIRAGELLFQGPVQALEAERQPRVEVDVSRPAEAMRLLRSAGWTVRRDAASPDRIVVEATSPSDAARINTMLVLNGIPVSRVALTRSSLEEIFLRVTAARSEAAALGARSAAGDRR